MRKTLFIAAFMSIVLSIFVIAGCGTGSPVAPSNENILRPTTTETTETDKHQWGTWIFKFHDADQDSRARVEAVPLRTGEAHFDVKDLVLPPYCSNCMELTLVGVIGDDWTINVALTNPSVLTGYDVMGIFPDADGPSVFAPDSYTDMFDIDGTGLTHNPYIVYDTGNENNAWGPAETHDHTFTFHRGEGQKLTDLIYVAAASYPENQDEVVQLKNMQITGPLYTDASNPQTITVEAIDHQDDIEYVSIDMSPVNGDAFTHMTNKGGGVWELYSYAEYGLSPGTKTLIIAAKSFGSANLAYNYIDVEIIDPPLPASYFQLLSGPTTLTGDGVPYSDTDIAVIGKTDGTSRTLMHSSATTIYSWNQDYTTSGLFLTLTNIGGDPNFPVDPLMRIAAADPTNPDFSGTYSLLLTNADDDIWDLSSTPSISYSHVMQVLDMNQLEMFDFKLTADNVTTPELDAILKPVDVSSGVSGDGYGYTLWATDAGAYPGYYPYVTVVRYEPPYSDAITTYDTLIGGVIEGVGEGKVNADFANGFAAWDGAGQDELIFIVSEGGDADEVEIFSANYDLYPETEFTHNLTITGLPGAPLDVAILPVGDAGLEDENWVCILTDSKTVEVYTFSGVFVESIFDTDAIPSMPSHIDTDLENLRMHVMMATGPKVSVWEYKGM